MSLRFIVGKPGGGKSFTGVKWMIDDLVHSQCMVVTNIPIQWAELNEYIQKKFPAASVDLHERLLVLDEADVFEFYRFRSGGLVLDESPDKKADGGKKLRKPEFIEAMKAEFHKITEDRDFQRPVHYYIDEAHNFFNAREWQEVGRGLLYYVSQHRHLHDNIYMLTQALGNVEKQLKSVTQDYHVIRNMYKESVGIFKQRGVFRRRAYYSEPNGNAEHYEQTTYKLDCEGIGACYQTCGALGIGYESAENDREPKKLPYWTMWAGAAAVFAVLMTGIIYVPSMASDGLMQTIVPKAQKAVVDVGGNELPPSPASTVPGVEASAPVPGIETVAQPIPVRVNMCYSLDGVWRVGLTDGRVLRSDRLRDGLEEIAEDYVIVEGQRYFWVQEKIQTLYTHDA